MASDAAVSRRLWGVIFKPLDYTRDDVLRPEYK
jgi:hypothetical protein